MRRKEERLEKVKTTKINERGKLVILAVAKRMGDLPNN